MTKPKPKPLDSASLIALAGEHGYHLTPRMLETFRDQGLLPRTRRERNRKRTPTWVYPSGTREQLLDLMRWREYTTDPGTLRVLLWIGGHQIDFAQMKQAVTNSINKLETDFLDELRKSQPALDLDDPDQKGQAVEALAAQLARRKESNSILPRKAGGTTDERAQALADLAIAFVGDAPSENRASQNAPDWVRGPAQGLFDAAGTVNLAAMRDAVQRASEAHWESVRQPADTIIRLLPVVLATAKAITKDDDPFGLGSFGGLGDEPQVVAPLVLVMLLVTQLNDDLDNQTIDGIAEFGSVEHQMEQVQGMSSADLERNVGTGSPQREAINELLQAHADDQLTPAPQRPPTRKNPRKRA